MKNTYGFFILLFCLFLGNLLSSLLPIMIPGSICGMALFLCGLVFHWIDETLIDDVSENLLLHMNLFFAPGAVNLIAVYPELRPHLLKILFVTIASTCLVLLTTGWTAQLLIRKGGAPRA